MKPLKMLRMILLIVLLPPLLYFGSAYLLSCFPTSPPTPTQQNRTIYLLYDEIHTDIIIKLSESTLAWEKILPELLHQSKRGYLVLGWGDRETYLTTPTWDKLKPMVAFKALFINTPSMMHLQHLYRISHLRHLIPISLSQAQQQIIEAQLRATLGETPRFVQRGYWSRDAFYDSPYPYNLFHTCNTWSGDILREANVSMSYWTPLSSNLVHVLKKSGS